MGSSARHLRVPVPVELELGQRADDGRDDFVRIEHLRRQGAQPRAFLFKPIHGTLARAVVPPKNSRACTKAR
jgi:hypothetical protein